MDEPFWLENLRLRPHALRRTWGRATRKRVASDAAKCGKGRRASFEALEARLVMALTVDIPVASAVEGAAAVTATVTRTGSLTSPLTVTLSSDDTTEATVPASVVIPINQASATFPVTVVDDAVADGTVTATITATAAGHTSGSDTIAIVNNDVAALRAGTTTDVVQVQAGGQAGQYELTLGPTPVAKATPLPVVDLSAITAGDQRVSLAGLTSAPYSRAQGLVKVDVGQRYTLSAWAYNSSEFNEAPLGFVSLDRDKLEILSQHVQKYELAADTTLARAVAPGATAIYLASASGWSNDAWEGGGTRALAWYGYQDSTGHTYADYTYTRNVSLGGEQGLWAAGGIHYDRDAGAYRIDLVAPWSGPALGAGVAVRNATTGETANMPTSSVALDPLDKFTSYATTIGGGAWTGGNRDESLFRPGTVYIQPVTSPLSLAGEIVVGPEEDAIYGGSTDPTKLAVEAPASGQVAIDLDVLGKGALGGAATVTIDLGSTAIYGTATIVPGAGPGGRAALRYTAAAGFAGTDVVTYTLRDSVSGLKVTHTVKIHLLGGALTAIGTPPSLVRDAFFTTGPTLAVTGNLTTTSNVRLVGGPAHGTVKLNSDGSFVYTPEIGFTGVDVFHGEALSSSGATPVTAIVTVLSSNQSLAESRLREVGQGMLTYRSAKGNFPLNDSPATNFDASGNPYLSWRVHILPYLGYTALYNQFHLNEPWNSANNLPLASKMPDVFRAPGDSAASSLTRLQLVSGEGAPYYLRRVNGLLVGPANNQIADAAQNTILAAESGADQAVTWTKPDDLEFNPGDPLASLGTLAGKFSAVMADGSVRTFGTSITPAQLTALVTVSGGETVDASTLARAYAASAGLATFNDATTDNYVRQLALAMLNYQDAKKAFPVTAGRNNFDANGNSLVSWRVHILPYLGYTALYNKFHLDEPWDSVNNLPLLAEMPDVFRSTGAAATSTTTRMQTFYGTGAPFKPAPAGTGGVKGITSAGIDDGEQNTIMIVETGADAAVPWTKPQDVAFDPNDPLAALGSLPSGVVRAAFFDGHVAKLPTDLGAATWKALATHAGGEMVDSGNISLRYLQESGQYYVSPSAQIARLREIGLGMAVHEQARNFFPSSSFAADGTPLLSWRVHILPYLGYDALYAKFRRNEPWDSPWNLALLDEMPNIFRSEGDAWNSYVTRVEEFVGPGAPFPESGTNTTTGPRVNQFTDGTSNTFMIVEAGRGNAVPWTKPADVHYNANNPLSSLVDSGPNLVPAFADVSVRAQGPLTPGGLKAFITRNGGEDTDNPPAITPAPAVYVHQTGGDTAMNEFGADLLYVVLDAAPVGNVTVTLGVSDPGLAAVDKPSLVFTPGNWNQPQRVIVRAVDDHAVNADRKVTVTVAAPGYAAAQTLSARIVNDDVPQVRGDFNDDQHVDGGDFLAWQRGYGVNFGASGVAGDADVDRDVDGQDFAEWASRFGAVAGDDFAADFDDDGHVAASDLAAWRGGFGTATGAALEAGDADFDRDVDGGDFLVWQRTLGGGSAATVSGTAASGAAALVSGPAMMAGLPSLLAGESEVGTATQRDSAAAEAKVPEAWRDRAFELLQPASAVGEETAAGVRSLRVAEEADSAWDDADAWLDALAAALGEVVCEVDLA